MPKKSSNKSTESKTPSRSSEDMYMTPVRSSTKESVNTSVKEKRLADSEILRCAIENEQSSFFFYLITLTGENTYIDILSQHAPEKYKQYISENNEELYRIFLSSAQKHVVCMYKHDQLQKHTIENSAMRNTEEKQDNTNDEIRKAIRESKELNCKLPLNLLEDGIGDEEIFSRFVQKLKNSLEVLISMKYCKL